MAFTVEATYENGVLKPASPLPLKEYEKVRVTVQAGVRVTVFASTGMAFTDKAGPCIAFELDSTGSQRRANF